MGFPFFFLVGRLPHMAEILSFSINLNDPAEESSHLTKDGFATGSCNILRRNSQHFGPRAEKNEKKLKIWIDKAVDW